MCRSSLFRAAAACAALALAGCSSPRPASTAAAAQGEAPAPKPAAPACVPAGQGDPMVGTWYSTYRQPGFAGDFQTLTVLSADGTMRYESQIKMGRRTRPALREQGCWTVAGGIYTMQTTMSNGEPVDAADPIYRNRYQVEKVEPARLTLRELKPGGQKITARRMQPGYRLPD
ncbi:hypothetical protein [Bordetella sp. 2513F-2]